MVQIYEQVVNKDKVENKDTDSNFFVLAAKF